MGIRTKIIMNKVSLVLLGFLLTMLFSGCVENGAFTTNFGNKVSAAEEIETSFLLISSAETRMVSVRQDIELGTYSSAKMSLNASEIDLEEALKILNNATSDYKEENQAIEIYKTLAEGDLDRIQSMKNLITAMEHFDKSLAYTCSEEFNLSKKELDITSKALNESATSLISAKEKVSIIDPDSVPVEQKSSIILLKKDLEASENMHVELKKMMSGMYPYMDGYECLLNGIEYGDENKWDKAADEFEKASGKFSESQKILEELKDSEYSEVSIGAIELCGILNKIQKDLPHIEAGCRYMEKGRISQANTEFSKVSFY